MSSELVLTYNSKVIDVMSISPQDLYSILLMVIEDLYSRGYHNVRLQWGADIIQDTAVIELNHNYKIQLDGHFSRISSRDTIEVRYY